MRALWHALKRSGHKPEDLGLHLPELILLDQPFIEELLGLKELLLLLVFAHN